MKKDPEAGVPVEWAKHSRNNRNHGLVNQRIRTAQKRALRRRIRELDERDEERKQERQQDTEAQG
jgi:hypothetical protein